MTYSFPDLYIWNGRNWDCFILLRCLIYKRYSRWGGIRWVYVHLVCDTDIIGVCYGKITTWGRRGYSVRHMVLGFLKTVSFNRSISFEIWVDIQGRVGVVLVVLRVAGDYLDWNVNRKQKSFVYMRHGLFVVNGRIRELLLEVFHLREHGLGFMVDKCNDKWNYCSDVGDGGF